MSFLAAVQFLTSIPLPWRREPKPEELARAAPYFPLVGLIIGLILAGLHWLFGLIFPAAMVNALLLVALVAVTGGLHLDGLVDTCDGVAVHREAADRLRGVWLPDGSMDRLPEGLRSPWQSPGQVAPRRSQGHRRALVV